MRVLLLAFSAWAGGIQGVFDAGWNSFFRTSDQWSLALSRIDSLAGVPNSGTLIVQYGTYEDAVQHLAYVDLLAPWFVETENRRNLAEQLSVALKSWDGDLWLGLAYDEEGWNRAGSANAQTLDTNWLLNQQKNSLMVWHAWKSKLGSRARQFYIPHEIARYFWNDTAKQAKLLRFFLRPLTDSLQSAGDRVMVAPYGNASLESASEDSLFLTKILSNWRPDVLAWQDGVGVDHMSVTQSKSWSKALGGAVQNLGSGRSVRLWADVEVFGNAKRPADSLSISEQLKAVQPYVERVVVYDYSSLTLDHYAQTMKPLFGQLRSLPLTTGVVLAPNASPWSLGYDANGQKSGAAVGISFGSGKSPKIKFHR